MVELSFPCPVCGSEDYEYLYKDVNRKIVGCEECLERIVWYEYEREEMENG